MSAKQEGKDEQHIDATGAVKVGNAKNKEEAS